MDYAKFEKRLIERLSRSLGIPKRLLKERPYGMSKLKLKVGCVVTANQGTRSYVVTDIIRSSRGRSGTVCLQMLDHIGNRTGSHYRKTYSTVDQHYTVIAQSLETTSDAEMEKSRELNPDYPKPFKEATKKELLAALVDMHELAGDGWGYRRVSFKEPMPAKVEATLRKALIDQRLQKARKVLADMESQSEAALRTSIDPLYVDPVEQGEDDDGDF